MIKGFRDFILRGNVIDLAIAVIIGAAFSGIVTQLTKSFIEPLIKLMGGGGVQGGAFIVNGVPFDWSAFINAIINFLIVAAVLYFFVVTPMNTILVRRQKNDLVEPGPVVIPEDIALLKEIRDLLKSKA
ncbi:MAG: large conductance mechanosensitive channel protein MscL [Actinobacteria bacterium]|nr:large conductance mechanosensitive channel protein MscL [Actinomycetota bacterium]